MTRAIIFLTLLLPFFGCDELEELLEEEIDVPISFQGFLHVESATVGDPSDPVSITSDFAVYNFENDPEVAELLGDPSEITEIKIKRIRYLFQNFEGNSDANVVGGFEALIGPVGGTQIFDGVQTHLESADANNTLFLLEDDFSNLNEHMTEFHSIGIRYVGSASDNPVIFDVDITVEAVVTIKPDLDNF